MNPNSLPASEEGGYDVISNSVNIVDGTGNPGCCAAVLGITILKIAVRLIVTIMMRASTTTTTVFVLSVVLRALFYSRTGGWEFVGRV